MKSMSSRSLTSFPRFTRAPPASAVILLRNEPERESEHPPGGPFPSGRPVPQRMLCRQLRHRIFPPYGGLSGCRRPDRSLYSALWGPHRNNLNQNGRGSDGFCQCGYTVRTDLQGVCAVLQVIGFLHHGPWQLAGFADRRKHSRSALPIYRRTSGSRKIWP